MSIFKPLFILLWLVKTTFCYKDGYLFSRNISTVNFEANISQSTLTHTNLDCAHQCSWRMKSSGDCNSYAFDNETHSCKLANLKYLEDPLPGDQAQSMMVFTGALTSLEMKCRGGEHCCAKEAPMKCGEGKQYCQAKVYLSFDSTTMIIG